MWDIPGPQPQTIHVTTGRALRRAASGVTVHRTALTADCITTFDGLPLTNRITTTIDLLRSESGVRARDLLDYSVRLGTIDADTLLDAVRREPGRAGNTALRKLVAGIEPGADAESERILHRLLRRAGITGWVPQYRVRLASGFAFIDIAFPDQRLAIEVDGRRPHGKDAEQFESDRTRQNELIAAGWRVLRFTWRNLRDDPDGVLRKIVQLLAA
jgi:very-short-patch-repair endonuclease